MDEDVLQAIFLHYIGLTWSVSLKHTLRDIVQYASIWKHEVRIPENAQDRRLYYVDAEGSPYDNRPKVEKTRQETYRIDFLLSQLPSSVYQGAGGYDDDEEEDKDASIKSTRQIKQQLLRQLATEVLLRKSLDGEVAIVQSDIQWFATGLSHSTLYAVMRFSGVSEDRIAFFKKFLEAPLDMRPVSEEPSKLGEGRVRKRGVPMAHALEKFFGELVSFFMDLAVNQKAGMLLYRLHDDLWLCGKPKKCADAWLTMKRFSEIMGLEFNRKKTGSVYLTLNGKNKDKFIEQTLPEGAVSVGFLTLDTVTGSWVIDQEQVNAHTKQLQKQLAACTSILSWVQTWNSCIGRFFGHTFGEPANCFGMQHVDSILKVHERMQRFLFDGTNGNGRSVTEHLKSLITKRLGVSDIPDAFLFMPEQFGGLGLRNPFISLSLVHRHVCKDPEERMQRFHVKEKESYEVYKSRFEGLGEQGRRRRLRTIYTSDTNSDTPFPDVDIDRFITMEEYTQFRESTSSDLFEAFNDLLSEPKQEDIESNVKISQEVKAALWKLAAVQPELALSELDAETKWLVQFHSRELFDYCGGLSIVDQSLLPLGVLKLLRSRKVTWQMVL